VRLRQPLQRLAGDAPGDQHARHGSGILPLPLPGMGRRLVIVLLTLAAGGLLAAVAAADTKHGITPISPAAGDEVAKGEKVTFRLRARGKGQVWVRVCKSATKSRDGVICDRLAVGRATRHSGGIYTYTPRFHDFPEFWLNTPGSYHWQAYRVACVGRDCRAEGPIVRFRVG
jgi:hypothetical protein